MFTSVACFFVCLDENLPAMEWKTRYKIGVGAAKGLHYLHEGCPRRIIHRDIKASNVLLTSDYEPQVQFFRFNPFPRNRKRSSLHKIWFCPFLPVIAFAFLGSKKFWLVLCLIVCFVCLNNVDIRFWVGKMASISVDSSLNHSNWRDIWVVHNITKFQY